MIEYGIFRKNGNSLDAPMENRTFASRESAQKAIECFNDGAIWLEVQSRAVTTWLSEETE